jgi:L-asparagine transporter-like permease
MLYGLAKEGNAPKIFASLSRTGIPMVGILVSAVIGIILVIMTYYFPKELFMYLLSIVVAGLIISWFIITITHMKFRLNRLDELKFKSLFYPYTNYFCILFLIAVVVIMTQIPDMLISIIVLPIWVIFIYMTYLFKKKD